MPRVDQLAEFVIDDRFKAFPVHGGALAAHFRTGTLGKAICESSVWLECNEINKRFRDLLADPFEQGTKDLDLFPKRNKNQALSPDTVPYEVLSVLWQLRHTIVHNVGLITKSDAVKLRLLLQEEVESPQLLVPNPADLGYVKRFLDLTARSVNQKVGHRLAELLTTIHAGNPVLFTPQKIADQPASQFGIPLIVAAALGTPSP